MSATIDHPITSTTTIPDDKANVAFIWFDPEANTSDDTLKQINKDLGTMTNSVSYPNNIDTCITLMKSIGDKKIFFIISGNYMFKYRSKIDNLSKLYAIFIFPENHDTYQRLLDEHSNIMGIFNNSNLLLESIATKIKCLKKQTKMISFYNQHQQGAYELSEQSAEFLWFQLVKCVIQQLPHSNEAKEELLDVCRHYYQNDCRMLGDIDNFANNYNENLSIWWYTKDTFVYELINKALRTKDIEQLYTFRYYIADLSKQLAQECRKTIEKEGTNFYLYRGTVFSKKEVEILKTNKGRLIATNGYWSTSRSRQTALTFANEFKDDADKQNILFEIRCDLHDSVDTIIVADISSLSAFPTENEFLFDVGSIFSIENFKIERENVGTELIIFYLRTSARGREIAQKYLEENKREMQYESPIIMLGILLRRLGKHDTSLHYFEKLRDNPAEEKLSHIWNRIGVAYRDKGKYHDALDCFNKAYNLITNANPPERVYLALIRHNQGQVHFKQYRTQLALKFYEEAADILTKEISDSNRYIAEVYRNIGRVYSSKCIKNYEMALRYQFDALNVRKKCLASDDVVFAFSYEEIGKVYSYLEQYDEALNYHLQALELRRKHLPPIHHNTALSFYQVGKMFYKLYRPKEAFQHDKQALEIMEKYPSSDFQRSNVLRILQHMILISKNRPQTALPYHLKLLEIKKNNDSVNYLDVVHKLLEISAIYRFINKTEDALNFNKDALDIQITKQLANESYLAREYFCLASEYITLGNMQCALDCYQQTLNINKRIYPRDHPFCVNTEKKINYIKSGQQRHTNTKVFSTGNRRSTFRHY